MSDQPFTPQLTPNLNEFNGMVINQNGGADLPIITMNAGATPGGTMEAVEAASAYDIVIASALATRDAAYDAANNVRDFAYDAAYKEYEDARDTVLATYNTAAADALAVKNDVIDAKNLEKATAVVVRDAAYAVAENAFTLAESAAADARTAALNTYNTAADLANAAYAAAVANSDSNAAVQANADLAAALSTYNISIELINSNNTAASTRNAARTAALSTYNNSIEVINSYIAAAELTYSNDLAAAAAARDAALAAAAAARDAAITAALAYYNAAITAALADYNAAIAAANEAIGVIPVIDDPICFNEGTKILCFNKNLQEEYISIENLKKGDLVKTYKHGYRRIDLIGKNVMVNNPDNSKKCMYKMVKTDKNCLLEDLIITGGHSILVDDPKLLDKRRKIKKVDDKYLLLSSISKDFIKLTNNNLYTYWHLTLETDDDNQRFGIWANGLLTETTYKNSFIKHNFKGEFSGDRNIVSNILSQYKSKRDKKKFNIIPMLNLFKHLSHKR